MLKGFLHVLFPSKFSKISAITAIYVLFFDSQEDGARAGVARRSGGSATDTDPARGRV